MIYDIQKASILKRFSAYLLDLMLLVLVAAEIAFLLSMALNFQGTLTQRDEIKAAQEQHYGVDFDISEQDFEKLTDDEKKYIYSSYAAFASDPEVVRLDTLVFNLSLVIVTFSVLIAYLLLEFLVPILFHNGQTLGKRIFSIAVMRVDGVKISTFQLFVRTVLGKCTVGTLIPIFLVFLFLLDIMPLFCLTGFALLVIIQLICLIATRQHTPIHELMSATVSVDKTSQLIFNSVEELTEYKKQLHMQEVDKTEY